ncbi:GNAT family N-acetyltransferase [Taibaiella chishuiensis]|uniref:CelD/BcsL family acetyltransferase involved in cellulose biosynthesis n=1 Tax=Taibaiella chishuiensis TaxID=1434707 RepID=A0A2P8DDD2_9BACT|nr:GNAT family N-acetyltransferase [Taibaiella chishuiensis]PSK95177.1 CelD/BcsL family acetyltransferase involved in cellulose biosynthesis [Taibaiella chishuiensis]
MTPKEQYRNFEKLQELPLFFQPWWLDTVCSAWDVALTEEKGVITGVMPYQLEKKSGLVIIRNPDMTPYLGPFFFYPEKLDAQEKTTWEDRVLKDLLGQLPRYDSCNVLGLPGQDNFLSFYQRGFKYTSLLTYHIDLGQPEAKLYAAVHRNHRYLIKQAQPLHTTDEGPDYLEELLELHYGTFSRKKKKYTYSREFLVRMIEASLRAGQGKILVAKDGNQQVVAGLLLLWDGHTMYLLISAVAKDTAHPGVVRLLIWEAICLARRMGLRIFDFEGSMDPGIEPFFRRFGGSRQYYLYCIHHRSLIWKIKRTLLG